jgi:LysR family glycine cleavage system transcriptional activator
MIERGTDLARLPLLDGDDVPWRVWQRNEEEIAWQSRPPSMDDSAGLLVAAEEGLGFALARWTLVTRSLQKGTLRLASTEALPYGSAYYFVCPRAYLGLPKVAMFREWIVAAARDFRGPPGARGSSATIGARGQAPG